MNNKTTLLLLVIFLTACSYAKKDVILISKPIKELKIKRIDSWTVVNPSLHSKHKNSPVDTAITCFDTLGRVFLRDTKFHSQSLKNYYSHGYECIYDQNDSLVLFIKLKLDKSKSHVIKDTIFYTRNERGKLISKKENNGIRDLFTSFVFDDKDRIESKIEVDSKGLKKKEWLYEYNDSLNQKIVTYIPYKSGGYSKLFIKIDTFRYNSDSTKIWKTDYNSNTHGNKYRSKTDCSNCIKVYDRDKEGNLLGLTRIRRPSDTLYYRKNTFDIYNNRTELYERSIKDTINWKWFYTFDNQNNYIKCDAYSDSILMNTSYRQIEYY